MIAKIPRRNLVLSVIACAVLGGCSNALAERTDSSNAATSTFIAPGGRHFLVFFDRSTSIGDASKALWLERDYEQLLKSLGPGDRLALYGVDDLTGSAPPIYEAELPAVEGEG